MLFPKLSTRGWVGRIDPLTYIPHWSNIILLKLTLATVFGIKRELGQKSKTLLWRKLDSALELSTPGVAGAREGTSAMSAASILPMPVVVVYKKFSR